jgi:hypothetical protein
MNKDEAKELYRAETRRYGEIISYVIDNTITLDKYLLNSQSFGRILLFPWDDWGLFNYIYQNKLLNPSNKLCAMRLVDVATRYSEYLVAPDRNKYSDINKYSDNDDDSTTHTFQIERLKNQILEKGYFDEGKHLLIFEPDAKDKFYLVDAYHRLIAYQDLIRNSKIKYNSLNCIVGEVKDVVTLLGRLNLLGKELRMQWKRKIMGRCINI